MTDADFQQLQRSPFSGGDLNSVFSELPGMATTPVSAIEDLGITPEIVAFVRDGLYNADFRTPPPDTTAELDDVENKLPGWSYVKTGTHVTALWVTDSGGGHVRWTVATGTNSDDAYIEQVIPMSATVASSLTHRVWVDHGGSAALPRLYVKTSYQDSAGALTGSEWAQDMDPVNARVEVVSANGVSGVPADTYFLRVRIGVSADTDLGSISVNGVRVVPARRAGIQWSTINGDKDDWAPGGSDMWGATETLVVDGGAASRDITGLVAPPLEGTSVVIQNIGTTDNLVLKHESGSSAASNRIWGASAADITIAPRTGLTLQWHGAVDGSLKRWRRIG